MAVFDETTRSSGRLEVICGAMFSGKTEELLRRIRRARIANQAVGIFKPSVDQRYHAEQVVSHDASSLDAIVIEHAKDLLEFRDQFRVFAVDEVQFLDEQILSVCNALADANKRVIISGLDKDYKGRPFGFMPQLMALADEVTKVHAICVICGSNAGFSFRKSGVQTQIQIGAMDHYEPRCRTCYNAEKKK